MLFLNELNVELLWDPAIPLLRGTPKIADSKDSSGDMDKNVHSARVSTING